MTNILEVENKMITLRGLQVIYKKRTFARYNNNTV